MAKIGESTRIKGELSGDEDLEIEGSVEGSVHVQDHLVVIGRTGKVDANVTAKSVVVTGQVTGNVEASERIEIHAEGVISGDIRAPKLVIQDGATVNGSISMGAVSASKPAAPAPAASPMRKVGPANTSIIETGTD